MGEFLNLIYDDFNYKLYVPSEYHSDKEFPLLVMLHGCSQNPDDFANGTRMNILAEKESFLVLYPDMNHPLNPRNPAGYNPFGCWNWFLDSNQHRDEGHPKLINELIQEVGRSYRIDSSKVYAAGLSAGGSMACILGVTYPDVFDGIAVCSGLTYDAANVFFLTDPRAEEAKKSMEKGVPDPYACGSHAFQEMGEYKKKLRVIVFHGICDTTVHPINGQQLITQWSQTNFLTEGGSGFADITPATVQSDVMNGSSYTQLVYHDGHGKPMLELWMIDQMGHAWSGGSPNGSYTDPYGPNASEIIWGFFIKNHPKPRKKQIEVGIEVTAEQPIPAPEAGWLLPTNNHSMDPIQLPMKDTSAHQISIETKEEVPLECEAKISNEVKNTGQEEPLNAAPKRNILTLLLSKLMKKKN